MRFRNTIIVLILLAVVGGYAYYASKQPAEEKNRLFAIKADDIVTIALKYPDREIELDKQAGKWTLVKPLKAEADDATVDNIARAIADCEIKRTLEEQPADLGPFGLAKPEVIVTVTTADKRTLPAIEVGKVTPVGFSAYVRRADKPAVMLASSAFPPQVTKTVNELRNRVLVKFDADAAQKLTLERGHGATLELEKQHEVWAIVKPGKYSADQGAVRQLLNSLNGARVEDFINDNPGNLSQFGLDNPQLTIAVFTGKEAARQSLMLGAKENAADKDRKGRGVPPPRVASYTSPVAKLDFLDVALVRTLLADGMSHRRIARELGVGKSTVTRIANNRTWKMPKQEVAWCQSGS